MDNLTHRLAAALGCMVESANALGDGTQLTLDTASANRVLVEYDKRCKEQGGIDHYAGREGG